MSEAKETQYNDSAPAEGSQELNGKGASFRTAPLTSPPGVVAKRRIRGASVPCPREL